MHITMINPIVAMWMLGAQVFMFAKGKDKQEQWGVALMTVAWIVNLIACFASVIK